jgi:hypothetical protein
MPEHHDDKRSDADDVDGAVASGRRVGSDRARNGRGLGERHIDRMPGQGV